MGRPRTRRLRRRFEVLDIRAMNRAGALERGQAGVGSLDVSWLPCRFGGARPFWHCPKCGRRCEVLYRSDSPASTGCRTCQFVAYESTALVRVDRLYARRDAILERLGMTGCATGKGVVWNRPKGMRWTTFLKLRHEAVHVEVAALRAAYEAVTGRPCDL